MKNPEREEQAVWKPGVIFFLLVCLYQSAIVPVPGPSGFGCLSLVMAGHIKFKPAVDQNCVKVHGLK